jgi:hypothetical protein
MQSTWELGGAASLRDSGSGTPTPRPKAIKYPCVGMPAKPAE